VLAEIRRLDNREALRFYNGFRTWKLTYRELYGRLGLSLRISIAPDCRKAIVS